ncbi:hypothetical protein ACIP2X_16290 [Streptomyces sp. NPDC089424]|uniref:hypothetical protein n=1 Tax=Streptomyces sp. NPDC089424 TaxID=3365917 RepID=UPI0038236897
MTDVHERDLTTEQPTEPPTEPTAGLASPSAARSAPRRGAADPVKSLMHRHRELCARAVDPLEIAAGLEAHGITDRTAARFRHRDVFSLAEEMYARFPRDNDTPHAASATPHAVTPSSAPQSGTPSSTPRPRTFWILRTLLPGITCTATLAALHLTHGQSRLLAAAAGTLAVVLSFRVALHRGPLSAGRPQPAGTHLWTCALLVHATLGDGLLAAAAAGGPEALPADAPDAPWPLTLVPVLALTLACAPAAWLAHHFAARARHKLGASRGLEDFAASVRPLLLGTFGLFLGVMAALLTLTATALQGPVPYPQALTLAALLFLARLLAVHGFTYAPSVILTATATAQTAALASLFTARLPHCAFLATPVETLIGAWGPGAIPTLISGTAALALLVHATRKLTRASAHAETATRW